MEIVGKIFACAWIVLFAGITCLGWPLWLLTSAIVIYAILVAIVVWNARLIQRPPQ